VHRVGTGDAQRLTRPGKPEQARHFFHPGSVMTTPDATLERRERDRPMKTPNIRFYAFVARFVDAVTMEALATELTAQRRARVQFQAAQREVAPEQTREAA
jgi:hypothetical protein